MNTELEVLKPGEYLLYEMKEGAEDIASLVFAMTPIGNIKVFRRSRKIYVYKESKR